MRKAGRGRPPGSPAGDSLYPRREVCRLRIDSPRFNGLRVVLPRRSFADWERAVPPFKLEGDAPRIRLGEESSLGAMAAQRRPARRAPRGRTWDQPLVMLLLVVALSGLSLSASADFEEGRRAFERGDYSAAYRAWLPLAQGGVAEAQFKLGMLFLFGEGVPGDNYEVQRSEAFKWFRLAADQGNAVAQWEVGFLHENGWGVPKNDAEAAKWYKLAAQQGQRDAQHSLATLYREGRGVAKDPRQAARWYLGAALKGHVEAQFTIGLMHRNGEGVKRDDFAAKQWYRKAAEQGHEAAQNNLGVMYEYGQGGLLQDFVLAHMWYNLAASRGSEKAAENRERLGRRLTASQLALAQQKAQEWTPTEEPSERPRARTEESRSARRIGSDPDSTGSGFVVSKQGHVLTNAHVVENCREVRAGAPVATARATTVTARDPRNDLALLATSLPIASVAVAVFRTGRSVRQGDQVIALGFPLHGILTAAPNLTTGTVSALAGLGNDTRHLQITAPIQPGNSGGPLLDMSGNVVGVVVGKLDALKVAEATGDIPQNVNFALHGSVARTFLEANGVEYATAPSTSASSTADIGDRAKRFTVLVECFK